LDLGKWIYRKGGKIGSVLIQLAAAFVFVCCLLNIGFWMGDSYSLREMARSYEETDLFFRQVDGILTNKIRGKQNQLLFETDGSFDETKQIDIRAYGSTSGSVQDMNTTYLLSDLLSFAADGGREKLHQAISEALERQDSGGRVAGEILDEASDSLETILPVTGISLSECSRWYSNPADFVLEIYQTLDEVSGEIYQDYQEYKNEQDESWSEGAPSNLKYCIEDSTTGVLYTNTDADDYAGAVEQILSDESMTSLYEGERSFNIMVTNPEHVMNQEASQWFMQERFVGTNERVFLAVDTSYPVSDALRTYAEVFSRREGIVWTSLLGIVLSLAALVAGLIGSILGAGWKEGRCTPDPGRLDAIPTELAAGLYMILAVLFLLVVSDYMPSADTLTMRGRIGIAFAAMLVYLIFLSGVLSLVRRIRTHTLWSNSITLMLVRTWRQVTSARTASGQFLFFYIGFVILNFLFWLLGNVGFFLMFVLDMVVLLYFLRDMAGKQSIYEGIHQISKGDLTYKIDTSSLQGETCEMAKAVNEMGDGLQQAVDSIVKNERLKAELITNVSHDIKTPLTSIVNYVDLLKRENIQGERVQQYLEVLDQKSQRLRQLTEDLVEASKITSGNIELHLMKLSLQSMWQQAYGEFQERFEEHGLILVCTLDKEPVHIMADGRQLWRILENLLGNICKYAMENTRVYVELYREDRTAYLSLQNTAREHLTADGEELTGRFVRGDKSRNTEGSGLGLSIAQSLVQLHGGTFQVTVEGDIFHVTLTFPVVAEDDT
jgi:signal transduction histidine kinase